MSTTLKPKIVLTVNENSYQVKQPTIGQIIDIEMLKSQITNGNYGRMVGNLNKMSILSLDMVDMFAHFKIMTPELLEDLSVESWLDLGPLDTLDIFNCYIKQFKPWYDPFSTKVLETWQDITDSLSPQTDNSTDTDGERGQQEPS